MVDIIPEICSQWYLIASCLGGSAAVAARGDIDAENSQPSTKMTRVIKAWIESGQDVHWSRFLAALTTVRLGAYSCALEDKLSGRLAELRGWCSSSVQDTLVQI